MRSDSTESRFSSDQYNLSPEEKATAQKYKSYFKAMILWLTLGN